MLKSGDHDLLMPGFAFYRDGLTNTRARTRHYWGHDGCSFTEQISMTWLPGAMVYGYAGEPAKALPPLRYGMRLNPDAGYLYYMSVGEAYFFLGETEQALLNLNEALARNPANLDTRVFLAATHAARGDAEAAQWEMEEIRMLSPGFYLPAWLETAPLTDSRQKRHIIELLQSHP
jgi:tetratricopeptide (TPR) repeat protein